MFLPTAPAEDIYNLAGGVHENFDNQAASEELLRGHFRNAGLNLNYLRRRQRCAFAVNSVSGSRQFGISLAIVPTPMPSLTHY